MSSIDWNLILRHLQIRELDIQKVVNDLEIRGHVRSADLVHRSLCELKEQIRVVKDKEAEERRNALDPMRTRLQALIDLKSFLEILKDEEDDLLDDLCEFLLRAEDLVQTAKVVYERMGGAK